MRKRRGVSQLPTSQLMPRLRRVRVALTTVPILSYPYNLQASLTSITSFQAQMVLACTTRGNGSPWCVSSSLIVIFNSQKTNSISCSTAAALSHSTALAARHYWDLERTFNGLCYYSRRLERTFKRAGRVREPNSLPIKGGTRAACTSIAWTASGRRGGLS